MEKLRKCLSEPDISYLIGDDLLKLVAEWNTISRTELKGWYLSQIIAGLVRKIIDPDVFLSVSIDSVKSWDQFPLVGAALRYGANPNVYFDVFQLGPAHTLVYAIDRANKHNLPILERDALCVMLIAMGSRISNPAFDKAVTSPIENYDKNIVKQEVEMREKIMTVEEWFGSQRLKAISNYMDTLKLMGSYVPSIVGSSISRKDIAFMMPEYIPTFEYLINCQADASLFENYPLNNDGEHVHIRRGEVVGMTQSIQGASIPAFKIFINAGVECSYFTMNRLCFHISEACMLRDQVYYVILLEMMKLAIKSGAMLDTKQYDMLKLADSKNKYNLVSSIEEEYKTPRWYKLCNATNTKVPDYLRKLAFNLGLDRDQTKEKMCQQIDTINKADVNLIKNSAINRQRSRMSSTIFTLSEFDDTKEYKTCSNGQSDDVIPEEYNDTLISFYRDGDKVYCYTSDHYQDMLINKTEPISGNKLSPEYLRQIQSQLDIITSLGLDPSKPISITKATDILKRKDEITSDDSDFASNTIIKILEGEKLTPPDMNTVNYVRLNEILSYQEYDHSNKLKSLDMYQDLLSKLQPSHQIITFYRAVYYILRQDPSKTNVFLSGYRSNQSNSFTYPIERTEKELKVIEQAVLVPETIPEVMTKPIVEESQRVVIPVTAKQIEEPLVKTTEEVKPKTFTEEPQKVVIPITAKTTTEETQKVVKTSSMKDTNDIVWVDEYGKEIHPDDLNKYHLLDNTVNRSKMFVQPPPQEITLETEPQYVMVQPPPQRVLVQPPPEEILIPSQPQKILVQPSSQRVRINSEPQELVFHTSLDSQHPIHLDNNQIKYYTRVPIENKEPQLQYVQAYYPPTKYAPVGSYEEYLKNPTVINLSQDTRAKQPEMVSRKIINLPQ